jgi:cob(I)alamin adenosyltransferase
LLVCCYCLFVLKAGRLADLLKDVQAELVVVGADIAMLKSAVSKMVVAGSAQAARLLLFA